jgi:hypothetical protein
MWGVDRARRYNNGRDLIPITFQLSAHLLENHPSIPISEAANIFAHDETRGNLSYCPKHLRPQMALIFFAFTLSGA